MNRPTLQTVTLPNGGTVTPTVELGDGVTAAIGATLVGILLPAAPKTARPAPWASRKNVTPG